MAVMGTLPVCYCCLTCHSPAELTVSPGTNAVLSPRRAFTAVCGLNAPEDLSC